MFHHDFSFDRSGWQHHPVYNADGTVSPHDYAYTHPSQPAQPPSPPLLSVSELATRFGEQSLHPTYTTTPTYHPYYPASSTYGPPSPPSSESSASAPSTRRPSYTCLHHRTTSFTQPSVRQHRQTSTRLQTSPQHLSQLSSLVSRMVDTGVQCDICAATPASSITYAAPIASDNGEEDDFFDEDEGFSEPASHRQGMPSLTYRRSSDFGRGEHCVAKNVRMRKGTRKVPSRT